MALTAGLAGSWAPHGKAVTLIPNAFATNIATSDRQRRRSGRPP